MVTVQDLPKRLSRARQGRTMNDSTQGENWLKRLSGGLKRTSSSLGGALVKLSKSKLDAAAVEELEGELIRADLGPEFASHIVQELSEGRFYLGTAFDEVKAALAAEIEKVLAPVAKPLEVTAKPFIILVAGVNGSGKTTTIGKLAAKFRSEGKSVMMVAGDTFRAAAIDQLKLWRERNGARAGRRRGGPGVRRARRRQDARRRYRSGRYRRAPAEPRRADERAGKNGARDAQGGTGGAT